MIRDTFDKFHERDDRGLFGDNESSARRRGRRGTGASDLHDLALVQHHETDRAVLVSADGDEARAVWLPKSRVEIERKQEFVIGKAKGGQKIRLPSVTVTVPEALAVEKGLL